MGKYKPEGYNKRDNYEYSIDELKSAMQDNSILEGIVVKSDRDNNIHLKLGDIQGIISKEEFEYSKRDTNIADIVSKVGKVVAFKVLEILNDNTVKLSRRQAQIDCSDNMISKLDIGRIIKAKVLRVEKFGIFCDIGCGIKALLPVQNFCINRITNLELEMGCTSLTVIVDSIDNEGRVVLSHKELLGTWWEEASKFSAGDIVVGTVRNTEKYGTFIEISPNLTGLAKVDNKVKYGDKVVIKIKKIKVEQLKVTVSILRIIEGETNVYNNFKYTKEDGIVSNWRYTM